MKRLKNMHGYSKHLYGSVIDMFRKMTCPDKMKTRKICSDFLLPFATQYRRSLSSPIRFIAIDIQGNDLFEILNDKEDMLYDMCEECAERLDMEKELLQAVKKDPEKFMLDYELSNAIPNMDEVAGIEMRVTASDTDCYGIPHCSRCGNILDLNCIPEGEDLREDLTTFKELSSLRITELRQLDIWYITRLLDRAFQSGNPDIIRLADKLVRRIYKENKLKKIGAYETKGTNYNP